MPLVLAAAGYSSSSSSAAADGVIPLLRIGSVYAEPTLDVTKDVTGYTTDNLVETLQVLGPQAQLKPNLATSWEPTSPTTYVYRLRHDVKFWDGNPLTATDVAYSLNYNRASSSQTAYRSASPGRW